MEIYAGAKRIKPEELQKKMDEGIVCFAKPSQLPQVKQLFAFLVEREDSIVDTTITATRFESRRGYDYISLQVPNQRDLLSDTRHLDIFFSGNLLLIIGEEPKAVQKLKEMLNDWEGAPPAPARCLYLLFSHLFYGNAAYLEDIEDEIAEIEEGAIQTVPDKSSTRKISFVRRKLLVLRRYYESVFDLLQDLEENQNGFFTKEQLRYFRIHTNRADRLANSVTSLRDYVTQVREAYQNQIDLNLNATMKLFTVLTAIFLPLTLIAGWYGMNLQMPEYSFRYAYPLVIALSLGVALVCIIYFKKKKWF